MKLKTSMVVYAQDFIDKYNLKNFKYTTVSGGKLYFGRNNFNNKFLGVCSFKRG